MGDDRRPARARTGEPPCTAARSEPRRRDRGGGRARQFTAITGGSVFTASLALLLAETVEHFTDENDWGRGFLVAVPNRHHLLWRPVDRADASVALDRMIDAALRGFAAGAGPLSPMFTGCGTAPGSRARPTRAARRAVRATRGSASC